MREFPEIGVAIDHSLVRTLRHVLLIVYMSMSQKIALASVYQQGIGCLLYTSLASCIEFAVTISTGSTFTETVVALPIYLSLIHI